MKAFPFSRKEYVIDDDAINEVEISSDGMELRDYFAAKIMQSLVLRFNDFSNELEWDAFEEADIAYSIADAMMSARKK